MTREQPVNLDRLCASSLLRSARRAIRRGDAARAAERLDWALLLMPHSIAAERLRIRLLIHEGNLEAAESMIGRRLLDLPNDAGLLLLRARCRFLSNDFTKADRDIRAVLAFQPMRGEALELAARIASRLGEHERAIDLLDTLLAPRHEDDRIAALLCRALINSGDAAHAKRSEQLLARMIDPPPMLVADTLLARGRRIDAMDYLESHLESLLALPGAAEIAGSSCDALLTRYLDTLEMCGHVAQIDRLVERVLPETHPGAAVRLARIMLARGRFRAAIRFTLFAVRPSPSASPHRRDYESARASALPVLLVASALSGRSRLAKRALMRMQETRHAFANELAPAVLAETWRRGLRGRALRDQRTPHSQASADRSSGLLRPLLHSAARTFEAQIKCRHDADPHADCAALDADLNTCRAAIDRAAA